jgi:hypothetical protein
MLPSRGAAAFWLGCQNRDDGQPIGKRKEKVGRRAHLSLFQRSISVRLAALRERDMYTVLHLGGRNLFTLIGIYRPGGRVVGSIGASGEYSQRRANCHSGK